MLVSIPLQHPSPPRLVNSQLVNINGITSKSLAYILSPSWLCRNPRYSYVPSVGPWENWPVSALIRQITQVWLDGPLIVARK